MLTRNIYFIKLMQGLFEYLLFFPVFLMMGIYAIQPNLLWIWIGTIPCVFFVGVLYRTLFSKQKWWMYTGIATVVGILSSLIFIDHLLSLLLIIVHPVIAYRGMLYVGRSWNSLLPISFSWVAGSVIYFIGFFLFRNAVKLNPFFEVFTICGLLMIFIMMFVSNSTHLKSSTLSKENKPFISQGIKRHNRVFLIITIALILVLSGKMIRDGLWKILKAFLQWIFSSGTEPGSEEPIEEPPPPDLPPLEESKGPSAIAQILDLIMTYAMYIIMLIVGIIFVLLLIKRSREWLQQIIRKFISFLKRLVSRFDQHEDYVQFVDEKENIFSWQEWKENQQRKMQNIFNVFKRQPKWDSLTNEQKVRFIYRHLLKEHIKTDYDISQTPRETLAKIQESLTVSEHEQLIDKLREAYEQTRYGEKNIDNLKIKEIYLLIHDK